MAAKFLSSAVDGEDADRVRTLDAGCGLDQQLVRLPDGRLLRVVLGGAGDPLVVFESGGGVDSSGWVTVQRLVSAQTRTMAYDRAGYCGSDPDPRVRSLQRLTADLATLLDARDERSPVVLVGASFGGALVRAFAAAHPEKVAGLVIVDGTTASVMPPRLAWSIRIGFAVIAALSRVGLHRPLVRLLVSQGMDGPLPAEDRALIIQRLYMGRNWRVASQETSQIHTALAVQRRLEATGLPDVPVTTLVGQRIGRFERRLRPDLIEFCRREMQAHPQGRFVPATRSNHFVPVQEPQLVADEIARIVRSIRDNALTDSRHSNPDPTD
jgi:pimeloyl-ACP methyl ester carboxylesterase